MVKKNETEKPTRFFYVGFVLQTQQKKNDRNRPTFRRKNEKPTETIFIFGSQPPHQQKIGGNRPTTVVSVKTEKPTEPKKIGLFSVHNHGRHMIPTHAH